LGGSRFNNKWKWSRHLSVHWHWSIVKYLCKHHKGRLKINTNIYLQVNERHLLKKTFLWFLLLTSSCEVYHQILFYYYLSPITVGKSHSQKNSNLFFSCKKCWCSTKFQNLHRKRIKIVTRTRGFFSLWKSLLCPLIIPVAR